MTPGTVVDGKYRIDRMLGEGGMATVYAATHIHLNDQVAIKVLLQSLASNPNVVERFMREARAAVRLKSEHVVRVIDVGTLPTQQPFIVMEYLDGEDVEAMLARRGALGFGEAVDYVLQVCEAMAEAHGAGIVHRDIKPANFVLVRRHDGEPSIKVLDFGIAKIMLADAGPSLTATQATMGTPAFMSPEQIRGAKDVDHRGDIWSLGVVLFQLIMGRVPFMTDTYGKLVVLVMREPTPPMQGVPPGLEAVVQKCLAKDRAHRYQNVAELAMALEPFAGNRAEASLLVQRCMGLARASAARMTPVPGTPITSQPVAHPPQLQPQPSPPQQQPQPQPQYPTPAYGNAPYAQPIPPTPAPPPPQVATGSKSRVVLFIVLGIVIGSIAGLAVLLAGCGGSSERPVAPVQQAASPPDAAVDAPIPDAGPPQAVLDAPAWIFRYSTAQRSETWTLRFHGSDALLVVETAQGTQRYLGSATDAESVKLDVSTGTAKLALDCKRAKRPMSAKCNDTKAKKLDVLDCYHPDFKEPMPFGPTPGIEYVDSAGCKGYRLVPPS